MNKKLNNLTSDILNSAYFFTEYCYNILMNKPKPLALIILDGFGHSENTEHNAIYSAYTPTLDNLYQTCPHTLIACSGIAAGLPEGQFGNSEVGHLNIGAGRTVYQDSARISNAILDRSFFMQPELNQAINKIKDLNQAVHIMGLLSDGGVHSHIDHLFAICELIASHQITKLYLHVFLDGRDTAPKSALKYIAATEYFLQQLGCGKIVSLIGRHYAMDRDSNWGRIEKAYNLITGGVANNIVSSAQEGVNQAYAQGLSDEFILPTIVCSSSVTLADGDLLINFNYRADRARQLSYALTKTNFIAFKRASFVKLSNFFSLTSYAQDLSLYALFKPQEHHNTLSEYLSLHSLKQLKIAETEKYAHITFFFNGGKEEPFLHETRILINSPKVTTYSILPEMGAKEITKILVQEILAQKYDFIVCNFANADMVGHTGNFAATVQAIEILDICLKQIILALHQVGGQALITADHGNAECMYDPKTAQQHTAHTNSLVPLIYTGPNAKFTDQGILADIAPTVLKLLNLPQPLDMTGRSLLKLD